ncbi:fimbrial protein, partial [Escherichia coli]|nr:fimbrial protein [Escherichia coli]EII6366601.1 fimbrial protein [Escherichia coli]HBA7719323.1 fimbrial protein [Escherichia coli]HBA8381944.1 fimbrial protein [Escherichia coli]HBB0050282.1 fimbrial protein [Escherichia coli]
MFWRMIISVPFFWCAMAQALPSASFPPPGMTLPEYWGEEHVWWDGRASFKGQV